MPLQPAVTSNTSAAAPDPNQAALDALTAMATLVQTAMNLEPQAQTVTVRYLQDEPDYAIGWKRQALEERPYWPPFPEAVAFLAASADSPSVRLSRMNEMMDAAHDLDVRPLRVEGLDAWNLRGRLSDLGFQVVSLSYYAASGNITIAPAAGNPDAGSISYTEFCLSALSLVTQLNEIIRYLSSISDEMANNACVTRCAQACAALFPFMSNFRESLSPQQAKENIDGFIRALEPMMPMLSMIANGYATVYDNEHMSYIFIERLSLNFITDPGQSDQRSYASIASAHLTSFLHQQDWLFNVMQWAVSDLAKSLAVFGDKICFFLKGGRGLQYLLQKPRDSVNDWDTQILVDPTLPWDKWWDTYRAVRDVVNNCLLRYNFVFSATLGAQAQSLSTAANSALAALTGGAITAGGVFGDIYALASMTSPDDQAFPNNHELLLNNAPQDPVWLPGGNSRAELLDVCVPRYWSIELLEQWSCIRPGVVQVNGVYCPPPRYFIEECIGMIRECDADASPAPAKRAQRMDRLLRALSAPSDDLASYLAAHRTMAGSMNLAVSLQQVAAIANAQIGGLATLLLGQFCLAYDLAIDPHLAAAFDGFSAGLLDVAAINAEPVLADQADLVFTWCETLSGGMTDHLANRGKTLAGLSASLANLVAQIAQNVSFRLYPVAEGLFAAHLHLQQNQDGAGPRNALAPAYYASISLYLPDCLSAQDVGVSIFSAIADALSQAIANNAYFGGVLQDVAAGTLKLFVKQAFPLGAESYMPLAVVFTLRPTAAALAVVTVPQWTFLDIRHLLPWCRSRAASIGEWKTGLQLMETMGALIEMRADDVQSNW